MSKFTIWSSQIRSHGTECTSLQPITFFYYNATSHVIVSSSVGETRSKWMETEVDCTINHDTIEPVYKDDEAELAQSNINCVCMTIMCGGLLLC